MIQFIEERLFWRYAHCSEIMIPSQVSWWSDSPLEIRILFGPKTEGQVTWQFSRDLLASALETIGTGFGEGDVRVACQAGELHLHLIAPDGEARLNTSARCMKQFLDRTYVKFPRELEAELLAADLEATLKTLTGQK